MTKEQVMTTALDMFSQYGIKSVSMDDIARNTGISKRTIYEFFEYGDFIAGSDKVPQQHYAENT